MGLLVGKYVGVFVGLVVGSVVGNKVVGDMVGTDVLADSNNDKYVEDNPFLLKNELINCKLFIIKNIITK